MVLVQILNILVLKWWVIFFCQVWKLINIPSIYLSLEIVGSDKRAK